MNGEPRKFHDASPVYFATAQRTAIACVAGVTCGAVLTPLLAPVILGIVGFGAAGPVAGTIAAGVQAGIGNVAAGSLFALAQSVAMGGGVPAAITALGAGIAGAGAGAAIGAVAP
ncbi:hypothetical protein BC834DRAFT_970915 [Gloeopeniophorella convolvens]|nr:hypothetical protein BC834DRAFT_970915 [Gloeopeniophorella convolvens]